MIGLVSLWPTDQQVSGDPFRRDKCWNRSGFAAKSFFCCNDPLQKPMCGLLGKILPLMHKKFPFLLIAVNAISPPVENVIPAFHETGAKRKQGMLQRRLWTGERLKCKTCTRALRVAMKVPDLYHRNGNLFSCGWGHITLTEIGVNWFQLGRREGSGTEKEGEGGIKDVGKLPSGAGVCQTTGCTSALRTPGKCSPAWAGPTHYGKTNQAYMANT